MRSLIPWVLLLGLGCGDDDHAVEPAQPVLSVVRHDHCLPAALEGAEVIDAPRLRAEATSDELTASYALGDALVRVNVVLYGDPDAGLERETERAMLERCPQRPECEEQRIDGHPGRRVDLGIGGQESTALFLEPGIRLSVLAPLGRSAAFAELLDFDCLEQLYAERHAARAQGQ